MQIRLIASKIKMGAAVANNFLNFLRMSCYLNGQLNITMTNALFRIYYDKTKINKFEKQ